MSLLQSGWMEALLAGVAWRSQSSGGAELVFAENLRLSAGLAELQGALRPLSRRFQLLRLSAEEALMLKAVALGNAGTPTCCSLRPTRKQFELSPIGCSCLHLSHDRCLLHRVLVGLSSCLGRWVGPVHGGGEAARWLQAIATVTC